MPVLPDVLAKDLALVLCGTGAGRKSAALGAYYANPGNKFWPTLHAVGLTPTRFAPAAFRDLLALGIGLTDIAKEHIGQDAEIDPAGADAAGLRRRIARVSPGILAFTSKRAASLYLGRPTGTIGYAFQDETIGRTRLFVLPSPSGAAGSHWDIAPWHALARVVKEMRGG